MPQDIDVDISICCLLADFLQHGHQAKHRVKPFLNDLKEELYAMELYVNNLGCLVNRIIFRKQNEF